MKLLPLSLSVLTAIFFTKFFPWPFTHTKIVDPLYETIGPNYFGIGLDFLIYFLVAYLVLAVIQLWLAFLILKALFKEVSETKKGSPERE